MWVVSCDRYARGTIVDHQLDIADDEVVILLCRKTVMKIGVVDERTTMEYLNRDDVLDSCALTVSDFALNLVFFFGVNWQN